MRRKVKLCAAIINTLIAVITIYLTYLNIMLPNNYNLVKGSNLNINGKKFVTIDMQHVLKKNKQDLTTSVFKFSKADLTYDDPDSYEENDFYEDSNIEDVNAFIKAYNIFPVKKVEVHPIDPIEVYPCGTPFGMKMFTKGLMVVGMAEVENGIIPSKEAGIKLGDMITSINEIPMYNIADMKEVVNNSNGKEISVKVNRNKNELNFKITPQKSLTQDSYKTGIWVRNSIAGIGTLTFVTDDGYFGGLGHPVCDIDTGQMMPLLSGEIININIDGVNKGKSGCPGELKGTFGEENNIGILTKNTPTGVYGRVVDIDYFNNDEKVEVAMHQEIEEGPAKMLTTINNKGPQYFDVNIVKINHVNMNPCKNMVIEITDEELIKETGGVVQGMSGSPIFQKSKMVGVMTHVFVHKPLKGYAIFIENMMENLNYVS